MSCTGGGGDEEMTDDVINTNIIKLYNNGMLKLHRLEERYEPQIATLQLVTG